MSGRRRAGAVVELHPTPVGSDRHPSRHRAPLSPSLFAALDEFERGARDLGLLYIDVQLQLAVARHLAGIVAAITLGAEPTVAQVHAIRELRFATTELRRLVVDYARRR